MATLVAAMAALTTLLCAVLLLRRYATVRLPLLLWSGLCFGALSLSNTLLVVDLATHQPSTYLVRLAITAVALLTLVFGLVWESD